MQAGEAIFVGLMSKSTCPFCESKKKPQEQLKLKVKEDRSKLRKHTPGVKVVGKVISHPLPDSRDVEIWEQYWDSETESKVGNNAHHIIPIYESFAKAKGLHKWLAWEVIIEIVSYSKKEKAPLGAIQHPPEKIVDGVKVASTRKVVRETKKSGKRVEKEETSQGHKVYGLIDYDINSPENGVWLPSNNAIYKWSKHVPKWKQEYANAAMLKHKFQFHDNHPSYSNSVLNQLKQIEIKLKNKLKQCIDNCDNPEVDPVPAPKKLKAVLNNLSRLIKEKQLELRPGKKVKKPWSTSDLAVGFKMPKNH